MAVKLFKYFLVLDLFAGAVWAADQAMRYEERRTCGWAVADSWDHPERGVPPWCEAAFSAAELHALGLKEAGE